MSEPRKIVDYAALTKYDELIKDYIDKHGSSDIYTGTSEYWNGQPTLIATKGKLYLYSDLKNIKIASKDGEFLSDIAFLLPTAEEKNKWNNKCSYSMDEANGILTFSVD